MHRNLYTFEGGIMLKAMLKVIASGLIVTVLAICVALFWFWTPDLPKEFVVEKYTNSHSQFYADSAGNRIHYRDQGLEGGPVLMLIHGTSASLHTWEPLVKALGNQYRLISLDLPGHGLTGQNLSGTYTDEVFIESVMNLMDYLNIESASLVGNSLGGRVAWRAAVDHPTRVRSLILLAPSGAPRQQRSKSNIGFKIMHSPAGQVLSLFVTPKFLIEKSLTQTVVDKNLVTKIMVDRYTELLTMEGNRQAMVDLFKSRKTAEMANLKALSHPKMVIWGDSDGILPIQMLGSFEAVWPTMETLVLTKIAHLPHEEAVDIVSISINKFCRLQSC